MVGEPEVRTTMLDRARAAALGRRHPEWFGLTAEEATEAWCRATLLGRGESFEAWTLSATRATAQPGVGGIDSRVVVLRTPHRGVAELPRPMAEEFAALHLAPPGLGPAPIHLQEADGVGPEGEVVPAFVVTEWVPGQVRDHRGWDDGALAAHARSLAALHARTWPTPGEVRTADRNPPGSVSASADLSESLEWWRAQRPQVLADPGLSRLVHRVQAAVAASDPDFETLTRFSLVHGDPCVPNILLTSRGPRYIDWEWARIGDPARDLAFIGGAVWAEPWYLSLPEPRVRSFLQTYLDAGGGEREPDLDALARRRDAWLLVETMMVAVYLSWVIADPAQRTARHERTRTDLLTRLDDAVP